VIERLGLSVGMQGRPHPGRKTGALPPQASKFLLPFAFKGIGGRLRAEADVLPQARGQIGGGVSVATAE